MHHLSYIYIKNCWILTSFLWPSKGGIDLPKFDPLILLALDAQKIKNDVNFFLFGVSNKLVLLFQSYFKVIK